MAHRRRRSLAGLGAIIESPYAKGLIVGGIIGAIAMHYAKHMRRKEHRMAAPVAAGTLPADALVVPFKAHTRVVTQVAVNAAADAAKGNAAVVPVAVPVPAPAAPQAVAGFGYGYGY